MLWIFLHSVLYTFFVGYIPRSGTGRSKISFVDIGKTFNEFFHKLTLPPTYV